jgi:glycosyltransferase involved in cell wall biosynthesis
LGPTPPGELGRTLAAQPGETTLHLHTSTDWAALLGGLAACTGRVLLTLHDATPLTGGCAYPLDCPHFPACADPCPRAFAGARARQAEIAGLLGGLNRRAALTLASPSRWLAGLARQALPELPVRVVPNGVPWPTAAELPAKALVRAVLGVAPGAPMALFAAHGGARAAYKSGPQWPDYWRPLREALPGAAAFAVGGDELGGQDGLTIWPYVDRAKLRLLMRAADVLLYPTLADNHPLVLLEAAAAELPVVSFAVGGVPEIVVHGETGLLATADEGPEFLRAARDMLSDPALCRRLGRAARAHGSRRFAAGRMAADYAALER